MEGLTWENLRASVEFLSHLVTAIGLPYAVVVFVYEQRKERENEEEEAYQNLSNAYIEFLEVVLNHADLQLRTRAALPDPTPEQRERMAIIFDMLVSLFERAYLVAYKARMDERERRRWQTWHDWMSEWGQREDFYAMLPALLQGEDPEFRSYLLDSVAKARRMALAADAANLPPR
ncbi:MAG: hypothetical protein ACKO3C_01525 [Betaproteobacteria bacterium]